MKTLCAIVVLLAGCAPLKVPEEYRSAYATDGRLPGSGGGVTLIGPGASTSSPTYQQIFLVSLASCSIEADVDTNFGYLRTCSWRVTTQLLNDGVFRSLVAGAADAFLMDNEAEIQWPDTKIAEVGTQIVATAAGGLSSSTGVYSAGNAFQCSGTAATCAISTLTADGTTSTSVAAYEFQLGANITTGDLGWAFRDNAGVYVAKIDEQGIIAGQMGTSATGYDTMSGVANINSTAVGNLGASGPDDLITYSLPANSLVTTNRTIRITAWGTCTNNANAKTFTLNFGSQVILTHACTASVAGEQWKIESTVIRTGASTQDWVSTYYGSTGAAGVFEFDPELGTATQTETGAIVIKMQSTVSTTDNDIVQEGMIVEYL